MPSGGVAIARCHGAVFQTAIMAAPSMNPPKLLYQHQLRKRKRTRFKAARRRPELSVSQILAWVKVHHRRTGKWPHTHAGRVFGTEEETWSAVDQCLSGGFRGLPGGTTLCKLIASHFGVRNRSSIARLTIGQILQWADTHRERTGRWPHAKINPNKVIGVPGEKWENIDQALRAGHRGLPGKSSLGKLLAQFRGHRCRSQLPRMTEKKILAWAKAHHRRTGKWPNALSGPIPEAPGETWAAVAHALQDGLRGHQGGTTLGLLLQRKLGVKHHLHLPRLTEKQILKWAKSHFRRTGSWPSGHSGPIDDAPGETWRAIEAALYHGCRGLPGGSTVRGLLRRYLPALA